MQEFIKIHEGIICFVVAFFAVTLATIYHNEIEARKEYKPLTPDEHMKKMKFTKSGTPLNRAKRRQILRNLKKHTK